MQEKVIVEAPMSILTDLYYKYNAYHKSNGLKNLLFMYPPGGG